MMEGLKNFKEEINKMYEMMGIKEVTLDICGQTFVGKASEKISEEHELDENGNVIRSYRLISGQTYVTDYEYTNDGKISKKITYLSSDKMLSKRGIETVEERFIYDSEGRLDTVRSGNSTETKYRYPTENEDPNCGMIVSNFNYPGFTIEKYDRKNRIIEKNVKNGPDNLIEFDSRELYEYLEDSYTKTKLTKNEILIQTFRYDGTIISEELRNKPDDLVETVVLSRKAIINENNVVVGYEEAKNGEIINRIEFNVDEKGRILNYSTNDTNFNFEYYQDYTSSIVTDKDGNIRSVDNYKEDSSVIESCKLLAENKYMYSYHADENDVLLAHNEADGSTAFGFDYDGLKAYFSTNGIISVEYKTEKTIIKKEYFVALMATDFTSLYEFLLEKYNQVTPFKIGKSYFTGKEIIKRDNTLGGMLNGSYNNNKEEKGKTE